MSQGLGLTSLILNYWQIWLVHTSYLQVSTRRVSQDLLTDSTVKFHDQTWHYTIYSAGAFPHAQYSY